MVEFDSDSSSEIVSDDEHLTELFDQFFLDKPCKFINTIGIQCPEDCTGFSECCQNHQCCFFDGAEQCRKVVSCNTPWYCIRHGDMCRCRYIDLLSGRCHSTIYYNIYKMGCNYCSRHQCRFIGCFQLISDNHRQLCYRHYSQLHFCEYMDDYGQKCKEVVDNPFEEIFSPSQMVSEDNTFNKQLRQNIILGMKFSTKLCQKHICQVRGCQTQIINDHTNWCIDHSAKCQYIGSTGQHCQNFYQSNFQPENTYCHQHQCIWNSSGYDDQRCTNRVMINEESNEYCQIHYKQYFFSSGMPDPLMEVYETMKEE